MCMIIFIDLLIFFINYYVYTQTYICTRRIKYTSQVNKISKLLKYYVKNLNSCIRRKIAIYSVRALM